MTLNKDLDTIIMTDVIRNFVVESGYDIMKSKIVFEIDTNALINEINSAIHNIAKLYMSETSVGHNESIHRQKVLTEMDVEIKFGKHIIKAKREFKEVTRLVDMGLKEVKDGIE